VPWTRLLEAGPARGPDGEPIADLAPWVRGEGVRLVLKRSWDYGGKSVFLGAGLDDPATQARLRELTGATGDVGWPALVDFALADREAWVVQELVRAAREPHLRVETDGPRARELYLDLSAYTNLGVAFAPTGGAVRASESRIVNILGGGGLAPLVREDVLERLISSDAS
jgi:hypothetical protein